MDPAQNNSNPNQASSDTSLNNPSELGTSNQPSTLDQTPPPTTTENLTTPPGTPSQMGNATPQTPTELPVQNTSSTLTPEEPQNVIPAAPGAPTEKKSKKGLIFLSVFLLVVFLIVVGTGSFAYAVAYEKVKLDKYPDFQKRVSYFVIGLPFMPKTPKFLLEKTALAHQDVTKQTFDVSVAIDSNDLASTLGLNQIDLQVKGAVDYSDPKNFLLNTEVSITKDFNIELRKKDKFLYFKINKLPTFLFAFLGLNSELFNPILEKWVAYDTTPLDTEARKQIQEDKKVDPLSEEFLDENFNKFFDTEVLSKMVLSEVEEDGVKVYKITLLTDPELIDHIGDILEKEAMKQNGSQLNRVLGKDTQKLSEVIKKMEWEIFIDKKNFYTRKILISAETEFDNANYTSLYLNPATPGAQRQKMNIAFAMKSDKFGEEVIVEVPTTTMTFEEFSNTISGIMTQAFGTLSAPTPLPPN